MKTLLALLLAVAAFAQAAADDKPVVAVIAHNHGTEVTDFLVPFGIIADSGLAEVHAVALHPGPVTLHPSNTVIELPQTAASFGALHPDGADYVIVPAVHMPDDPELATWLQDQRARGATIMSVCDGAKVLASAGLLQDREATSHWYSLKDLRSEHPRTRWRNDRRYVFDDQVITTSGVSASLPATLALLEHIAGHEPVATYAQRLGVTTWTAEHDGASFRMSARTVRTGLFNRIALWNHERLALDVPPAADEAILALLLDAYSRTWRSSITLQSSQLRVQSRHGVIFHVENKAKPSLARDVLEQPLGGALDAILGDIEHRYGKATADFVALQLEYPRTHTYR